MKFILLLILTIGLAWSANLTSTADGSTAGTNWTGGATPANGDTLTIQASDSVWLPSGDSLYATVNNNGIFNILGTLGIKDSMLLNNGMRLYMGPGAVINGIDSSDIVCANAYDSMAYYLVGSSDNRATVINVGDWGTGSWKVKPLDIQYVDFVSCTLLYWHPVYTTYVKIAHSTFTDAPVRVKLNAYVDSFDVQIDSCDFRGVGYDFGGSYDYTLFYLNGSTTNNPTGPNGRYINHCTFSSDNGARVLADQKGFVFKNSVYKDVQQQKFTGLTSRRNYYLLENIRNTTDVTMLYGMVDSCIFYTPRDNPHYFHTSNSVSIADTISHNIFISTYENGYSNAGDVVLVRAGDVLIRNNLLISDKADALLNALSSDMAGTYIYRNNTTFCVATDYGQVRNEAGGRFTGTLEIYNNLTYSRDSTTSRFVNMETGLDNQVTYTEYNGTIKYSDIYYNVTFSPAKTEGVDSGFGLHDFTTDPQFHDTARTLAMWNQVVNGGDSSYSGTTSYLLGINGYADSTQGTPSDRNAMDLYTWLITGFSPTNALFDTAGLDGEQVGAFEAYTDTGSTTSERTHESYFAQPTYDKETFQKKIFRNKVFR